MITRLALSILLFGCAQAMAFYHCCHGAEPPRKPALTIAVDTSPQSLQLQHELFRRWDKPNPALSLTKQQLADVAKRAAQFRVIQLRIREHFDIRFVTEDAVPIGMKLPAVRAGRGVWQSVDRRAFLVEGRPLAMLAVLQRQYCEREVHHGCGNKNPWDIELKEAEPCFVAAWAPFLEACEAERYYTCSIKSEPKAFVEMCASRQLADKFRDLRREWQFWLSQPGDMPAKEFKRLQAIRRELWIFEPAGEYCGYDDEDEVLSVFEHMGFDRQSEQWADGCWDRFLALASDNRKTPPWCP